MNSFQILPHPFEVVGYGTIRRILARTALHEKTSQKRRCTGTGRASKLGKNLALVIRNNLVMEKVLQTLSEPQVKTFLAFKAQGKKSLTGLRLLFSIKMYRCQKRTLCDGGRGNGPIAQGFLFCSGGFTCHGAGMQPSGNPTGPVLARLKLYAWWHDIPWGLPEWLKSILPPAVTFNRFECLLAGLSYSSECKPQAELDHPRP